MNPIDVVLDRLGGHRLRPNGTDRWRACCPAHGGSNPSALSIGVGRDGQVLIKCWHGCDADEVVASLGLELADLFPPRESAAGKSLRRKLISAGQALDLLDNEMTLAVVCASDLAAGRQLDESTRERLTLAAARVGMLRTEVHS